MIKIWRQSLNLTFPALKRVWAWVIFSLAVEAAANYLVDFVRSTTHSELNASVVWAIGASVMVQMILSAFGVIIISQVVFDLENKRQSQMFDGIHKYFKYVLIETTRAIAPILLKFMLLIVPGFVEVVRLYFIPFVVQFDENYQQGKIDALEKSRILVRGRFWTVALILILTLALSMLPRLWLVHLVFLKTPGLYGMSFFLVMACEVYSDIAVYLAYKELVRTP